LRRRRRRKSRKNREEKEALSAVKNTTLARRLRLGVENTPGWSWLV
jgi:hypothetical protein